MASSLGETEEPKLKMMAGVLAELLLYLNWKNVTLVFDTSTSASLEFVSDLVKPTSNVSGIMFKFSYLHLPQDDVQKQSVYFWEQCQERIYENSFSSLMKQRSDSVLLITNCLESLQERLHLVDTPHSLFATRKSLLRKKKFLRILTVRGKPEVKNCLVNFDNKKHPSCLHNAMGSELSAVTLQYLPFVRVQETEFTGFSVDLWTHLGTLMNFTYTLIEEPSGVWGYFPSEDDHLNESVGVVGRLLRQEIDVPMSVWGHTFTTAKWADFTLSSKDSELRCFTNKKILQGHDFYFLTHPFTGALWLVTLLANFLYLLLSTFFFRLGCKDTAKIVFFLAGFSFSVIGAFYGGALTMFMAKVPDPPFSDILDVAGSSIWDLKLAKGEEAVFRTRFNMSDPRVSAASRKYTSQKYIDSQAKTYKDTILTLFKIPHSVVFTSKDRISTALISLSDLADSGELHKFCQPLRVQVKNSP